MRSACCATKYSTIELIEGTQLLRHIKTSGIGRKLPGDDKVCRDTRFRFPLHSPIDIVSCNCTLSLLLFFTSDAPLCWPALCPKRSSRAYIAASLGILRIACRATITPYNFCSVVLRTLVLYCVFYVGVR